MDRTGKTSGSSDDYTQEDEDKMDRVSQSGAEGAFGSDQNDPTRTEMLEDAKDAFKGNADGTKSTGETY